MRDVFVEVLQALLASVFGLISVNSEIRSVVSKASNEEVLLVLFAVGLVLVLVEPRSALSQSMNEMRQKKKKFCRAKP